MKTISKIFFSLVAVLPFITSCKEEIVPVGGPENENSQGVYFSTLTTKEKEIELDPAAETTLSFPIFRTKEDGKISVPVKLTTIIDGEVSEASFFAAEAPEFEDGQTESEIVVTFPNTELGIPYTCNIECVDPDYVFTYSDKPTAISFTVTRVKWNRVLGPNGEQYGSWTDDIFSSMFNFSSLYAVNDKLEIFERDDKPGFFRIMDVYNPYMVSQFWGGAYPVEEFEENCTPGTVNYIDATDPTKVWLPAQTSGATVGGDGYIEFASCCEDAGFKGEKEYGTLVNGVIKFPVDGILVNFTVTGGWYTANSKGKTVIVLPGYKDVDYSLSVEADYSDEGVLPVYIDFGTDVAKVKYDVYEGAIAAADVHSKALEVFKKDDATEVAEAGWQELSFEKSGSYSIVAVALDDKGEMQNEAFAAFYYVAADDDECEVVFDCMTEPTPARYASAGLNEYNSYAYAIWGSNLTDVKVGVYKFADVATYGLEVILGDLLYEDAKTNSSVSSEILAKINGVGGYASVFTKLKDATDYVMFVWATNGKKADYKYSIFSTEVYSETFHSLGTCLYTDDLLGPLFSIPPVSYNVEIQESDETPGKYKLIYPYGSAYPYNEPGDYDTSKSYDIVVDASDPDRVLIAQQEIGCNWGYGMMSIESLASNYLGQGAPVSYIESNGLYGKLKDGIITMPQKGMILFDDDGANYANNNGAFKIVLPSAQPSSVAPLNVIPFNRGGKAAETSMQGFHRHGVRSELSFDRSAITSKPVVFTAKASSRNSKPSTGFTVKKNLVKSAF